MWYLSASFVRELSYPVLVQVVTIHLEDGQEVGIEWHDRVGSARVTGVAMVKKVHFESQEEERGTATEGKALTSSEGNQKEREREDNPS